MTRQQPPKFNLQIIQQIYETQQKIFQEDSRFVVESFCRTEQLANLTQKANASFKKEKEHFEIARNLITEYANKVPAKKKASKEQFLTLINKDNLQNKKISIPGLIDLTKFVFNLPLPASTKSSKDKGNQQNTYVENLFTFSIIPSYFNFFWTNSSIQTLVHYFFLINHLNLVNNDQYDSIARVVFVTPGFLLYSLYAFQPIFSKLLNYNEKNINNFFKDELTPEKISSTVSRYNYMMPKEVLIAIWCSKNPASTFYNSFLKVALSSSTGMYIYNLLNFSQVPSKDVLANVNKHFKSDNDLLNSIITAMSNGNPYYEYLKSNLKEIAGSIDSDEDYKDDLIKDVDETCRYKKGGDDDDDEYENDNPISDLANEGDEDAFQAQKLFNSNDQKYCPEIFQPLFLSSHDLNLFDFVNGKSSAYLLPDRLEYFRVFNVDEEAKDNLFNKMEKTMAGGANYNPSLLRHLLQLTDPLPKFTVVPPNINTLNDFITEYLVERGDITTYSKRKYNAKFLLAQKNLNIVKILKKVGFSRKNDIMALSAFTNVEKKLDILDFNSTEARNNMYLILDLQKREFLTFKAPSQASEYFKNPNQFISDFNSTFERLGQYSPNYGMKIVYSKLMSSEKIDLQTFIEYRSNRLRNKQPLKKLDQEFSDILAKGAVINEYISQNIDIKHDINDNVFDKGLYLKRFIDAFELNYFNNTFQGKSTNHESFLIEANSIGNGLYPQNDYKECTYLSDMIIEAFQEKSLTRKIDILSRCLSKMRTELCKGFPPNKSPLAEPEFEPTHCAVIMKINPPNFYSNYVFFRDMTGFLPVEDIFVGFSRSIKNYLDVIVNNVFTDQSKISSCMLFNEEDEM